VPRCQMTNPRHAACDPARPPDWRWQRAAAIVAAGQHVSTKREDPPTCQAVRFIRALRRYVSDRGARVLTKRQPEIAMALKLHQGNPLRKLEIECRILARQTPAVIGRATSLPPSVVKAYGDLFYNVQDKLDASVYIIYAVVGMPVLGPVPAETLAMACAYLHGPQVIPAWMDYLVHAHEHHSLTTAEGRSRASIALLVQVYALPSDAKTGWSLVRTYPSLLEISTKPAPAVTVARAYCEKVARNLDAFPWRAPIEGLFAGQGKPWTRESKTQSCETAWVA